MIELFSIFGRISRTEYWLTQLGVMVITVISLALHYYGTICFKLELTTNATGVYSIVVLLPTLWIALVSTIKRWHDLNKSGWMFLVHIVPVVGTLYTFSQLGFIKGTNGRNQFGPDPTIIPRKRKRVVLRDDD